MKAMVLAAGLGTRLRPLTEDRPKALVTIAGRTLLEITLTRLSSFGVRDVIVNVHHFAEMIGAYLNANQNFGMRIEVSREEALLDTGGGLKKAAWFFLEAGAGEEPFIVHNVDVVSTIDIRRMVQFHIESKALATLATQKRETSRYLLFDAEGRLCGRRNGQGAPPDLVHPAKQYEALAFCGVHVLSPRIFSEMSEEGAFSIVSAYLDLAKRVERICAFRADSCYWRDLGRPESLIEAARDFANGAYSDH